MLLSTSWDNLFWVNWLRVCKEVKNFSPEGGGGNEEGGKIIKRKKFLPPFVLHKKEEKFLRVYFQFVNSIFTLVQPLVMLMLAKKAKPLYFY